MENANKNTRLPATKKTGKVKPGSSKSLKIPSDKDWQKCIVTLQFLFSDGSCEDENLNTEELKIKTKQELHNLKPFLSLFFQVINMDTERGKTLENNLPQFNVTEETDSEIQPATMESNSLTPRERIPIDGKSCDFARKAGIFFFNPYSKNGLHLSKIYLELITELMCEIFAHHTGKVFSYRYIHDNMLKGANKKPDSKL